MTPKNKMVNIADFYILHDGATWEEGQFKKEQRDECSFWMQTQCGYRFKKWFAVIGDTIVTIPCAVWLENDIALFGISIRDFLGQSMEDKVSHFVSHQFEIVHGEITKDVMTHMHITYDLYASMEDFSMYY